MTETANGLTPTSTWRSGRTCHVGICVPDLDEARAFYCGLLGFEEAFANEGGGELLDQLAKRPGFYCRNAQIIVPGGCRIELQEYTPIEGIGESALYRQGLNHLSFGVVDVHAEYKRLTAAGVHFRIEPVTFESPGEALHGYTFAHFDDPWGLALEIMSPPAGSDDDEQR